MKLVTFEINGQIRTGAVTKKSMVLDLFTAATPSEQPLLATMQSIVEHEDQALDAINNLLVKNSGEHAYNFDQIRFLPPLPVPNSIRDFANFELHCLQALETSMRTRAASQPDPETAYQSYKASGAYALPPIWYERPFYFKGNRMTCSGHKSVIEWPYFTNMMDYELEFAAIIGKKGKNISHEKATSHIFGYTLYNDFSARDEQVRDQQFRMGPSKGKDFDTGNAMGPWIVTRDELPNPYNLAMSVRINGETQGSSNSSGMQHSFEDCIAFVSRDETLYPGDVFGSGTAGNGCGFETGRYLAPGDSIELDIEELGILQNTIGERRA
ncbi:fumarylacetoacetate hydrolase family protein [Kordiimonas pumila]|uniref:Fumarylacetoacetate hydrolase family protein n=1 Tax=Kordiimonas pumila TaxID=2161677 RepID=A0ABV7D5U8_9PROT|nr:fumarylacetoacetate hydrolase family protein [Kordiimonas pumila]